MLLTLLFSFLPMLIAQTTAPDNVADGSLMLQILIPTGGVSGTLSVVWYYLIKHLMKQNQTQFQFALKQNQEQFDKALVQIEKQHRDNLEESRRVNDKLFEVIKRDAEYKEILAGVLKGIETAINRIQERI